MQIVQVNLRQPAPTGPDVMMMTTWLEKRPDVKVGSLITLKDVEGKWEVSNIFGGEHDAQAFNWHHKWGNNI